MERYIKRHCGDKICRSVLSGNPEPTDTEGRRRLQRDEDLCAFWIYKTWVNWTHSAQGEYSLGNPSNIDPVTRIHKLTYYPCVKNYTRGRYDSGFDFVCVPSSESPTPPEGSNVSPEGSNGSTRSTANDSFLTSFSEPYAISRLQFGLEICESPAMVLLQGVTSSLDQVNVSVLLPVPICSLFAATGGMSVWNGTQVISGARRQRWAMFAIHLLDDLCLVRQEQGRYDSGCNLACMAKSESPSIYFSTEQRWQPSASSHGSASLQSNCSLEGATR